MTARPPDSPSSTLDRFRAHHAAFRSNEALRTLYGRWYRRVSGWLPAPSLGRRIELGSGPGFARDFIPDLELSDLVHAPWLQHRISALALPFAARSLGALVMFDVLHHLPAPARFFAEAERVLRPGGRLILCEPFISPLSYPVYRFLHEEGLDAAVDPFDAASRPDKDPFEGNQIVPTLIFGRGRSHFVRSFPRLHVIAEDRFSGWSYPLSGGFSRRPLLPWTLWKVALAAEDLLPAGSFRWLGFRMLVVIEAR